MSGTTYDVRFSQHNTGPGILNTLKRLVVYTNASLFHPQLLPDAFCTELGFPHNNALKSFLFRAHRVNEPRVLLKENEAVNEGLVEDTGSSKNLLAYVWDSAFVRWAFPEGVSEEKNDGLVFPLGDSWDIWLAGHHKRVGFAKKLKELAIVTGRLPMFHPSSVTDEQAIAIGYESRHNMLSGLLSGSQREDAPYVVHGEPHGVHSYYAWKPGFLEWLFEEKSENLEHQIEKDSADEQTVQSVWDTWISVHPSRRGSLDKLRRLIKMTDGVSPFHPYTMTQEQAVEVGYKSQGNMVSAFWITVQKADCPYVVHGETIGVHSQYAWKQGFVEWALHDEEPINTEESEVRAGDDANSNEDVEFDFSSDALEGLDIPDFSESDMQLPVVQEVVANQKRVVELSRACEKYEKDQLVVSKQLDAVEESRKELEDELVQLTARMKEINAQLDDSQAEVRVLEDAQDRLLVAAHKEREQLANLVDQLRESVAHVRMLLAVCASYDALSDEERVYVERRRIASSAKTH